MKFWCGLLVGFFLLLRSNGLVLAQVARYNNPGQGLFLCHYDKGTPDIAKGSAWLIFWGQLQPRDPRTMSNPADSLNREELDKIINRLRSGKNMYLPIVLYNAQGRPDDMIYPPWLSIKRILFSRGNYPNIWDQEYRVRVKEFMSLLSSEFERAGVLDKIEYIEMAVGGNWAAPEWWLNENDLNAWLEAAGCNDGDYKCFGTKVNEGVSAMIDIHAEAFSKSALMMVQGACRYTDCNYTEFNKELGKYGMRLMIKGAGLGHRTSSCGYHYEFSQWSGGLTKSGQEPWGPSVNCKGAGMGFDPNTTGDCKDNYELTYTNSLLRERNSYYCIYGDDLFCGDAMVQRTNQFVADHLGAQIRLASFNLSASSARVEGNVNLTIKWENTGAAPLLAPLKQGLKWTPVSYKLFLEYVRADGSSFEQVLPDNLQTNTWTPVKNYMVNDTTLSVQIPGELGGDSDSSSQNYKIYLGLTDPNGEKSRFVLINTEAANEVGKRRYLIADNFAVTGKKKVPSTPTVTPGSCPKKTSGDANCDGRVSIMDFGIWKLEFMQKGIQKTADFNGDGKVSVVDFGIWKVGFLRVY